jgi:hypothetical protein
VICYLDMTFCSYYCDCAKGATCRRALTPQRQADADKRGLLVAKFWAKPTCLEKKKETDHN